MRNFLNAKSICFHGCKCCCHILKLQTLKWFCGGNALRIINKLWNKFELIRDANEIEEGAIKQAGRREGTTNPKNFFQKKIKNWILNDR